MGERISRREALRLGALAAGTAALGALAGCGDRGGLGAAPRESPIRRSQEGADAGGGGRDSLPPVVDRLAVWTVVDNAYNVLEKSARVGSVDVQRAGLGLGPLLPRQLQSEWGLGLHLASQRGTERRAYLLDFGLTPTAELSNLDFLKIDPSRIDALVLSHGHYDHFGGLVPLLSRLRHRMHRHLPLYVGGEDTFCHRWIDTPDGGRQSYGVLDRRSLARRNVKVMMVEKPAVIAGQAFTTGAIPRTTFEKVLPAAKIEMGVRHGAGCDASHFTTQEQAGQIVPDQFWNEHATCFNVKDRGLVVISSCGHGGIVNTVRQAQAVSGVEKIHAVMGGFHLAAAPEPYIAQEVDALKELDPEYLVPMHCSGELFARLARQAMPGRVITNYTGTRYVFGA